MSVKFVAVVLAASAALAVVPVTASPSGHAAKRCHAGVLHTTGTPTAAFAAVVRSRARPRLLLRTAVAVGSSATPVGRFYVGQRIIRTNPNGCIRVPNERLRKLFGATVGGEPVVIHP